MIFTTDDPILEKQRKRVESLLFGETRRGILSFSFLEGTWKFTGKLGISVECRILTGKIMRSKKKEMVFAPDPGNLLYLERAVNICLAANSGGIPIQEAFRRAGAYEKVVDNHNCIIAYTRIRSLQEEVRDDIKVHNVRLSRLHQEIRRLPQCVSCHGHINPPIYHRDNHYQITVPAQCRQGCYLDGKHFRITASSLGEVGQSYAHANSCVLARKDLNPGEDWRTHASSKTTPAK